MAEAGAAYVEGGLSESDLNTLQSANNQGTAIESCVDGGGTPTPNTSTLSIDLNEAVSVTPNNVSVEYTVSNVVTSGAGGTLSPTIEITADGERKATDTATLSPGETTTRADVVGNIPSGTREICVAQQ